MDMEDVVWGIPSKEAQEAMYGVGNQKQLRAASKH